MTTNCPNCGAPTNERDICEYCGTVLADHSQELEKLRCDLAAAKLSYCNHAQMDYFTDSLAE